MNAAAPPPPDDDLALARARLLLASRSWRATAPLRALAARLRGATAPADPVVSDPASARRCIATIERTLSWKLTAPLRAARIAAARFARPRAGATDQAPVAVFEATLLSRSPFIVYAAIEPGQIEPVLEIGHALRRHDPILLVGNRWRYAPPALDRLEAAYRAYVAAHPSHDVTMLCQDEEELAMLQARGLRVAVSNRNLQVDERVFDVMPDVEKRWDAVHNARLARYKRHHLAADIDSLLLITSPQPPPGDPQFERCLASVKHAVLANRAEGPFRALSRAEVARWVNAAHVGLCLSQIEGAMRASIEYLCCGLPVVTTPSVGGRSRYFDEDVALVCDSEPPAVAAAVRTMIARRLDPADIRRRTLQRLAADRRSLNELIAEMCRARGGDWQAPADDRPPFRDHELEWTTAGAFLARHGLLAR